MHGSVHVHMVYSVRVKLAVRITAPSAICWPWADGKDAGRQAEAGDPGSADAPPTECELVPWCAHQSRGRPHPEQTGMRSVVDLGRRGEADCGGSHVPCMYFRCTFRVPPMDLAGSAAGEWPVRSVAVPGRARSCGFIGPYAVRVSGSCMRGGLAAA